MKVLFDTDKLLLFNEPTSKYQISKKHNLPYTTVNRATRKLLELGLIELIEERAGKTNPRFIEKIYGISKKGRAALRLFEEGGFT